VGSCTCAGNPDPDGRVQGLSTVDLPSGQVTLKSLAEAWPDEMGNVSVLVKLLSPAGPVPLHAHPTRAWARRHLGSPFGKTEAWSAAWGPLSRARGLGEASGNEATR
jgi:hypothetical protein